MCITCQSVLCLAEVIDITFGHGCVHINTSKNGWSIGKSILHHIFSQCNCILYIIKHIASVPKTSSFHLIVFVLDFRATFISRTDSINLNIIKYHVKYTCGFSFIETVLFLSWITCKSPLTSDNTGSVCFKAHHRICSHTHTPNRKIKCMENESNNNKRQVAKQNCKWFDYIRSLSLQRFYVCHCACS